MGNRNIFVAEGYSDTMSKYSENSMSVKHVREVRGMARCVACTAAESRVKHIMFDSLKCHERRTSNSA